MNHELCLQVAAGSDNGLPRLYAALAFPNLGAFLFNGIAARAPNCPIYAAPADKCRVRRIDDGIYPRLRYIPLNELKANLL